MTIKELAQLAGVSASTVSKIMNQKDESISAETREHVLKLAKEYHYQPYASVSQPSIRTLTIGVLLRTSASVNLTVSGILSFASNAGYSVLLRDSSASPEQELKHLHAFLALHVDGLIWEPLDESSLSFLPQLEHAGIPCAFFKNAPSADEAVPYLDFSKMGYLAAEKLIQAGHTDIACLLKAGTRTDYFYEGYKRCLFEHRKKLDDALVFHIEDGIPVQQIAVHRFTGIVVSHYAAALRLYQAVDRLHYSIPYDLSVVSLRDDARIAPSYPALSAITVPHLRYGYLLAEYLIKTIEKKEAAPFALPLSVDHNCSIDIPYTARLKKIVSLGSINIDNYMNVDALPHSGRTVISPAASLYPGGKCINEAIGAAKLGHRVSVIGRVGNDTDADLIYSSIHALQIDSCGLMRTRSQKTGQAYIFVQPDGESMISIMSGANNLMTAEDVAACERLFVNAGYCLLQTEVPMPAVLAAAELAKKHRLTTVLKPSACRTIPDALLRHTDILVPNEDELGEICFGLCPAARGLEEKARFLLSRGAGTVIVTRGAAGCFICKPGFEKYLPAADFNSVDSSGAGDAFISALVSYLLYGYDIEGAARIAAYAAGFSTTRQGVSPSLVDKDTLEAYILQKEPQLLHAALKSNQ